MASCGEWTTVTLTVPQEMADGVTDFCCDYGPRGVVVEDVGPSFVRITAYFPAEEWNEIRSKLAAYLADLHEIFPDLPAAEISTAPLKNENWATAWQDRFESMAIGRRLIVTPPWIRPEPAGRHVIIIEPAEAFGTGTHETTQGCLELLEDAVDAVRETGKSFSLLDIGCGSGILAIAGLRLGAGEVRAVDNDPLAVRSTGRNAELNGLSDRLRPECLPLKELADPADIVTANLDPQTLLANREHLVSLFRQFLIVSGVPLNQWDQVKALLAMGTVTLRREIARSEWGCGLFERE